MIKIKIHIVLLLLLLTSSGCGGGGGSSTGGSDTTTGTVSGTLSLAATGSSSVKNAVRLSALSSAPTAPLRRASIGATSVSGEKIVKFQSALSDAEIRQIVRTYGGVIKKKLFGADNTYVVADQSQSFTKSAAANSSKIEYAENNQIYHVLDVAVTPNDPSYTNQTWNYGLLNLPRAWSIEKGSSSVIVAVIDTGVALTHPDLTPNLTGGYDFVGDTSDSDPSDNVYYDSDNRYSHGTHVAGIISAVTNNAVGVAGVSWNVKIMPVRVLGNDGSGTDADIIEGIYWAVQNGAKIINLSLGAENSVFQASQTFKNALQYALDSNVTIVAAAGNESHYVDFPANYPGVIAVSAVDSNGNIAYYSNRGSEVWVCAPGGNASSSYIYSTVYDKYNSTNSYVNMAGTSMACPHIAGLAALLYSRGVTTPEEIRQRLKNGSASHSETLGYGLPDAYQILGIAAAKVFYATTAGTVGSMITPQAGGAFTVSSIPVGQAYICAFIDIDQNGSVSPGDMFAHATVASVAGTTVTQDLTLTTVSGSGARTISDFIMNDFQL